MKQNFLMRGLLHVLSLGIVLCFLCWSPAQGDEAKYFYDDLGRLATVIDGSGNVAVYKYDEVGNLLSIEQITVGGSGVGIFHLSPSREKVNAEITIQGFGFTTTPGDNQVSFNGTSAIVLSATPTTIVATVPSGATTGPVTVTNGNGTATSPRNFEVLVPPLILGVEPSSIPIGTINRNIIIEGANLISSTAVTFTQSGLTATILPGGTDVSLPIDLIVESTVPLGSYPFQVETTNGIAQSGVVTISINAAEPTFSAGPPVSILMPLPETVAPQGPTMSITPLVSVEMP